MDTDSQQIETSLLGKTRFASDEHKTQKFSTGYIKTFDFGMVADVQSINESTELICRE